MIDTNSQQQTTATNDVSPDNPLSAASQEQQCENPNTSSLATEQIDSHHSTLNSQQSSSPQPSTLNSQPTFPRSPAETPRAYSAFMTFFQLGHCRTLQHVADKLGEKIDTVRRWSWKFNWSQRIQSYNAGVLQQNADTEAASLREQAAERSARMTELRQSEWSAAQKLLSAVHIYLEGFGDEQVEKMTIAQVARALTISSEISRQAIAVDPVETAAPEKSSEEVQLGQILKRVLGKSNSTSTPTQSPSSVTSPEAN